MIGRLIIAIGLSLAALIAVPAQVSAARVWAEGGSAPFSVTEATGASVRSVRGAPGAALVRSVLWEFRSSSEGFDPFHAERLPNGNTLITSRNNEVVEVTPSKYVAWSYTRLADNPELEYTYSAKRLANGNTIITDRAIDRVIEIDASKRVVWQYGVSPNSLDPGCLVDPFYAERLADGTTLIVDNRGGNRVIKVRTGDYDKSAPSWGYTAGSIVWQYGQGGVGGTGLGQLASPRFAEGLPDGAVLITDSSDRTHAGERIIEVTPDGRIRWQFGVTGVTGSDATHLFKPSAARRLADGNTLIAEEDGGRVLEVDPAGSVVDWYGKGAENGEGAEIGKLRSVQRTPTGTTLIADQDNRRVAEFGYPPSGTLTSGKLSLGMPGVRKTISAIRVLAQVPQATKAQVEYSLDGGDWKSPRAGGALPAGSTATQVRYRVVLTSNGARTPVVRMVEIDYDVAPTVSAKPKPRSGGSSSGPSAGGTGASSSAGTVGGAQSSGSSSSANAASAAGSGIPGASGTGGLGSDAVGQLAMEGPADAAGDRGPRFLEGTVLRAGGAGGAGLGVGVPGTGTASGGSGGFEPRAVFALGLLYLSGFVGAALGNTGTTIIGSVASRFGWR